LKVEIWSDVVCPWCYIGKRRFESALAQFPHRDEVEILWRSFELDPSAPALRTEDYAERLASKYGMTRQQAIAKHEQLTEMAAREGLAFHFEAARSGNTFNAHRLLHLAEQRGLQGKLKERLMLAYFSEGEPIGDVATLARLAEQVGISAADAQAVLASSRFADDVRADERQAQELGINGVPFFVLDRRYGISGAQPAELFAQALTQAWAEAHPSRVLTQVGAAMGDAACSDDSCAI
jgi:predicted DsbA family dithiol-disulfide isomerase